SHIAGQRQIGIRVGNQDHTFIHLAIDIFEYPRILVRVQAEIMTAYTCVPGSRVFAIALAAEDVVLNTRDVLDVDARLDEVLGGGLSFRKNGERAALAGARLAKYHGPANLGVIAVHLWRELGSDDVAFLKAALGRRVHPEDFRSSGGDQHKVVFGSAGPEDASLA